MIGRRNLVASLLGRLGAIRAIGGFRTKFLNEVTILAYHRILDVPDENSFPFDIELVSASVAAFSTQMKYVKENYKPTTFATLLQCLDRGEAPPSGTLIITFDDGFADNYYNAFPILRQFDIPATIFLSTGYIDNQEMYWYEKLCYAVMTTNAHTLTIPELAVIEIDGNVASRRSAMKALMRHLKQVPDQMRLNVLDDCFNQLLPEHCQIADPRSGPLTWRQISEMSTCGIEFGSHGVFHPVLSKLTDTNLKYEMEHSKHRIGAMLDKPVQVIAYPVGGEEAFDDRVRIAAQSAGYRLGLSYISGIEKPEKWDAFALRRLHVERYVGSEYFKAMLSVPELFAY